MTVLGFGVVLVVASCGFEVRRWRLGKKTRRGLRFCLGTSSSPLSKSAVC